MPVFPVPDSAGRQPIDPFGYFSEVASAIPGLGGHEHSPDPDYCFHTAYHEYLPGTVLFRISLSQAQATHGELSLRVHGFRPGPDQEVVLVASLREKLGHLRGGDLLLTLRFKAFPGVHYALYGAFSEPSDLAATALSVETEERGDTDPQIYADTDTKVSNFADPPDHTDLLVGQVSPSLALPVSQACSDAQLASAEYLHKWPTIESGDPLIRWSAAFVLQALECYGFLRKGAQGFVHDDGLSGLPRILVAKGCKLGTGRLEDMPSGSLDFLVLVGDINLCSGRSAALDYVSGSLKHLMSGGLAIFAFDYAANDGASPVAATPYLPTRQDIEHIAMRILGFGSEVAQLNFGGSIGDITPFGLIVRR